MLSNLDMKVEGVLGISATQVLKVGTRHVDGLLLVGRGSDGVGLAVGCHIIATRPRIPAIYRAPSRQT